MNIVTIKQKMLVFVIKSIIYKLTIEHYFQIRIVMGPMEEHNHNDRPLFIIQDVRFLIIYIYMFFLIPVFNVENVKNIILIFGDILVNSKATVAPTESNKNPSTG